MPRRGTQFVLIDNDGATPVTGTFAGLAEGATVTIGGIDFTISYKGLDGLTGNDVVLTEVTPVGVYVDDSWAGTPVGTTPATSAPAGLIFGYNAFDTIPAAMTQVAGGGTVTVYGGTYPAAVNVNKVVAPIQIATNPNVPGETTVDITGAVTLNESASFQQNGTTALTFTATIDAGDGSESLTVDGTSTLTFGGAVGGGTALASFATDPSGTTVISGGVVRTSGAQSYGDAVQITTADATLTSTGNAAITFSAPVDGPRGLTVNTGGVTTFANAVGGLTALASLTTDAPGNSAINGGSVQTTGTQTYHDAATLANNPTLTASTVSFLGTVSGGSTSGLAIAGNAVFGDAAGDTVTGVTSLAVSGSAAINTNTVTTSGTQLYSGTVTVANDPTLTGSTVRFLGTVAGGGTSSLAIGGNGVFGDAAGDTVTGLTSLAVSGTAAINTNTVTTSGTQQYGGAVTVANNPTLTGSTVTFLGTVSGGGNEQLGDQRRRGVRRCGGGRGDRPDQLVGVRRGGDQHQYRDQQRDAAVRRRGDGGQQPDADRQHGDVPGDGERRDEQLGDRRQCGVRRCGGRHGDGIDELGGVRGGGGPYGHGDNQRGAAVERCGDGQRGDDNVLVHGQRRDHVWRGVGRGLGGDRDHGRLDDVHGRRGRWTALASLTTDAGGTTAINGGAVTTTGGQTYHDNVTLGASRGADARRGEFADDRRQYGELGQLHADGQRLDGGHDRDDQRGHRRAGRTGQDGRRQPDAAQRQRLPGRDDGQRRHAAGEQRQFVGDGFRGGGRDGHGDAGRDGDDQRDGDGHAQRARGAGVADLRHGRVPHGQRQLPVEHDVRGAGERRRARDDARPVTSDGRGGAE